jgi:hypothetical protein
MRRAVTALLLTGCATLAAAEFRARVVDNLGKPISGALVEAHCLDSTDQYRNHKLFTTTSGPDGAIIAKYKERPPACERMVSIRALEANRSVLFHSFRTVYILKRPAKSEELHEVVKLPAAEMRIALRNLLTSEVYLDRLAFYYEDRLRPALRSLVTDPEAGVPAQSILAFIGTPDDLRLIGELEPPPQEDDLLSPYRWLFGVTCSLLEPTSEAEWTFLRKSALGGYGKGWPARGAVQSLTLIASPRSRAILEEVSRADPSQAKWLAGKIRYINSTPAPLRDSDLDQLARRVGQVIGPQTWISNQPPEYNEIGDKALVNISFETSEDVYVYTAVFHRLDTVWILRGVRETAQGLKHHP